MTKKNILIIDDEVILARAMELKLTKAGYSVVLASNGKQALEQIKNQAFDLALLDLLMPEMDGWEVLTNLKQRDLKIIVIVTSNLGQAEDIARAKKLGAADFLVKSNTTLLEIQEKIQKLLAD